VSRLLSKKQMHHCVIRALGNLKRVPVAPGKTAMIVLKTNSAGIAIIKPSAVKHLNQASGSAVCLNNPV